jgi:hypothetical protein
MVFRLHWFLSGYWERSLRALWVLVALWLLFAVAFAAMDTPQNGILGVLEALAEALAYSLGNLTFQTPAPEPDTVRWYENLVDPVGHASPHLTTGSSWQAVTSLASRWR